ncbi:hypothetical protein [Oceanispirochaeta sp. M1]|uniref:hypothetical protein n=1 Tax=Oceanispirochaeta sp. M1 TaxID=2283433 RepID=UPI001314F9DA|nr:hypothetical protein [Oceanispirochaeta sp. M1]NPD74887.1 hypothetical protein [Oceanispirochaeta sp. M1]
MSLFGEKILGVSLARQGQALQGFRLSFGKTSGAALSILDAGGLGVIGSLSIESI